MSQRIKDTVATILAHTDCKPVAIMPDFKSWSLVLGNHEIIVTEEKGWQAVSVYTGTDMNGFVEGCSPNDNHNHINYICDKIEKILA